MQYLKQVKNQELDTSTSNHSTELKENKTVKLVKKSYNHCKQEYSRIILYRVVIS